MEELEKEAEFFKNILKKYWCLEYDNDYDYDVLVHFKWVKVDDV